MRQIMMLPAARRLLALLLSVLATSTALVGQATVLAAPAHAGQVGVTVTVVGRGWVEAVEGLSEAGAYNRCNQIDTYDPEQSKTCARWRSEAPFATTLWLRPHPGWGGDTGWATVPPECDQYRTRDGVAECGITSDAFGSSERQVTIRFKDIQGPAAPTTSVALAAAQQGRVDWRVQSDQTASRALCQFDTADWFNCGGGSGSNVLPEGRHVFSARLFDRAGLPSDTTKRSFTVVDTAAVGPAEFTPSSTAEIRTSSLTGTHLVCRLDDAATTTTCPTPSNPDVVTLTGLADGPHRLEVAAEDGEWKDYSPAVVEWTVDTVAPTTIVQRYSSDANTLVRVVVDADEQATHECRVTAEGQATPAWRTCTTGVNEFAGLAAGYQLFEARSTDRAGNHGEIVSYRGLVRPNGPDIAVAITQPHRGDVTVTVTAPQADRVWCSISGVDAQGRPIDLGDDRYASPCTTFGLTQLPPGEYRVEAAGRDDWGNVTIAPTVGRWTVTAPDLTAPRTMLSAGPRHGTVVPATSATLVATSDEPGTYACTVDGATRPCLRGRLALSGLAAGPHTVTVAAVDEAGNRDATPEVRTWSVPLAARAMKPGTGPARGFVVKPRRGAFDGREAVAGRAGATLTAKVRGARRLSLVAAPGRGQGRVVVLVGRTKVATVDLSKGTGALKVIDLPALARPTSGSVVLRAISAAPVRVQGLGWR